VTPRVLVTGATGFVGGHVLRRARAAGWHALGLARRPAADCRVVPEWSEPALIDALEGIDTVVHSASVVHRPGAALEEVRRFNVGSTRALEAACRAREVRRIVYLSTIKVHGETPAGTIDEHSALAPESPYAATKLEAERQLEAAAESGGPELSILRLCPVFGVGDKGNVRTMIQAIAKRRFALPGDGSNQKSLVHVSTVADVVLAACSAATRGVYVVADREVPSVGQLSDTIARALGRPKPWRIPERALYLAALGCELAYRGLRREPRIHRGLIRKALLPSICSPARVERELGVTCHADLYAAICEEIDWLRAAGAI
jgi:nucleoside-diphosphate-sugar epimerase